ncbi:MAG TPA: D-glycerate dehydrogenase [Solirubrobacteraceae bacterium]|nr:D-glycerate dehydrogenase [Solirubrobacteraceae bacterium]
MARCFVTRRLPFPALDRLRAAHEVEVWPSRLPPSYEELTARAADAEGLLTLLTDRVDAALIQGSSGLRAISNYAVGYDNIDLDAAAARGIPVGNTPDVLTDATADLTWALLLAAARKLPEAVAAVRDGDWLTWEPAMYLGASVFGATLGIVGMGRIGRAVAQRASGFEMEVLGTGGSGGGRSGTGSPGAGDSGGGGSGGGGSAAAVSLDTLLERSDFVSLHCPLTPETHHLIDDAALARMRPSAILINTARGPIVDHDALRRALFSGEIAGAALDVTDPEPLPPDDPLLSAPNLIVAPHIGSATRVARERMADLAVDNLLVGLDGRPMPHQVGR